MKKEIRKEKENGKRILANMTVEEWIEVEDNPIQRNTERHAAKAITRHLKKLVESHIQVTAAILPSGKIYKVDGHTRAYLWKLGKLERPREDLDVYLHKVRTIEDVTRLYTHHDNSTAAEGAIDKLHGAYRFHGVSAKSSLLKNGGVTTALRTITYRNIHQRDFSIYTELGNWIDELQLIDERNYNQSRFNAALIAALLLNTRVDGEAAFEFWDLYNDDGGSKVGRERDGVQMLCETIEFHKNTRTTTGWVNLRLLLSKALACYQGYMTDRTFTCKVRGIDVDKFITKHLGAAKSNRRIAKKRGSLF